MAGIAYILDEDGGFKDRCNMGMVELEAISEEQDMKELRELVEKHANPYRFGRSQEIAGKLGTGADSIRQGNALQTTSVHWLSSQILRRQLNPRPSRPSADPGMIWTQRGAERPRGAPGY